MPHSLVIVNPRASKVRVAETRLALTERLDEVLARRDGTRPRIVETTAPGEVRPLVEEALAAGVAAVVGVGGDGSLRDIAAVLASTDIPLGLIPAGTGNQVAAELGIPRSIHEAAGALAHARPRAIDLGTVTVHAPEAAPASSTFVIGCGAGFDAELMATTPHGLKQRLGAAAYFLQGTRMALRLTATPCRLTVDDETIETEITAALIGNMGHLIPGRLELRLPLDPASGQLDLIAVRATNLVHGARGLLDQLRRTEFGGGSGDGSIRLRGRSLRIEPATPLPLQIDGDHVGSGGLEAHVLPGALKVLVPQDG